MFDRLLRPTQPVVLGLFLSASVAAAGAATLHRYVVSQTSGSGGATNFLQTSATSSALQGEVGASPDTTYSNPFGVFGVYDAPGSTFGIGVLGASTTGYGLAGESLSNAQPSILAYPGGDGIGLEATTSATSLNPSVYAETKGRGDGIDVYADQGGYAILATSRSGSAVYGLTSAASSGNGLLGNVTGEGVIAEGYSGNATHPAAKLEQHVNGTDYLGTFNASGNETMIVQAATANRSSVALTGGSDVQISGDLYVYGKIYQNCLAFPAIASTLCQDVTASTSLTTHAVSRAAENRGADENTPARSVDRMGTSRLVAGRALVRFDRTEAAALVRSKPYLAFVTPLGESRGLYVADRTPLGFEVRENGGGRSTTDFEYRVLAEPADASTVRETKLGSTLPPDRSVPAEIAHVAALRAHPHRIPLARPPMPPSFGRR